MTLEDIMDLLEGLKKDSFLTVEDYDLLMNNIKVVSCMIANTRPGHYKIQLCLIVELLK